MTNWSVIQRPVLAGIIMFLGLFVLTQGIAFQRYLILKSAEDRELANHANFTRERLQTVFSYSFSTTRSLAFIVSQYGIPRNFNQVASELMKLNPYIDAVQLVQGGVITHVYPLQGNEPVIGVDILKDTLRRSGALTAIKTRSFFVAGPIHLIQGGEGFVARLPIYKGDEFQGFSAVVIRLSTLLKAAQIDTTAGREYSYQLAKVDPETGNEEFFLKQGKSFKSAAFVPVEFSSGEWRLYIMPEKSITIFSVSIFSVLGLLLSLTGGLFAWFIVAQPAKLARMVEEKTRQIREGENIFRTTLERFSQGFVSLDRSWRFTYVNKRIATLTGKDPAQLVGKNVWEAFPEAVGSETYKAFRLALETQQHVNHIDYFAPLDLWQENDIYPSPEGLTVFVKDISEAVKSKNQVILERNLSESIINSLPGVFYLYDEKGNFLKWNKNFEKVTGYTAEEVVKMHPLDFFEGEEKLLLRERIREVFQKGNSDVEAFFLAKDGTKTPFYFTGWAINYNEKRCLIGVGIDISKRKKAEQALLQSYDDIRRLNSHLQNIREEERAGIAREIHDELGQLLTGIKMDISSLANKFSGADDDFKARVKEVLSLIDETVITVRRISSDLRPGILDDLGLVAALEWQSGEFGKRTGIPCRFQSQLQDIQLPKDMATGFFRTYQESLTNIMRHAGASQVSAQLRVTQSELELTITDNGKGFNMQEVEDKRTLGLIGMKERAHMMGGRLSVTSTVGKGTTVLLKVPFNPPGES